MSSYYIVEGGKSITTAFNIEAIIEGDVEAAVGMVDNISIKGFYMTLLTGDPPPLQKRVRIDLYLSGSTRYQKLLRLHARIVRRDGKGVAVQFGPMSLESSRRLRAIVAFMAGEDRDMMSSVDLKA